MNLSWKARRRWALVLLIVGLPAWIILAVAVVTQFDRPAIWLEVLIYVALGIAWALPFRWLFKGIGQPDPNARTDR